MSQHTGFCWPMQDWPRELVEDLVDLGHEMMRARAKFPGNRFMSLALAEEVGELAKAQLQKAPAVEIRHEALQVACLAMRIAREGDASLTDITDEEAKP
jgi:hypothetical protein